jgi:hypothetical protein
VVLLVLLVILYLLKVLNAGGHAHLVNSGEHQIILVRFVWLLALIVKDLLGISASPVRLGLI